MNKLILTSLLILFGLFSLTAQIELDRSVFSNGAINATAGNLRLQGSIGQAITGPTQANSIIANGGFWATASRSVACGDPVSSLADSGEGSLREAIACAVTGDTIRFTINGSIVLTSGPIQIDQGVVIDADNNSIIIDAEGNSRLFQINTNDGVVFRNLILQRGSTTEFGGAVFGGAPFTAINCNFNNNQAELGGAISVGDGDLNLINCNFAFNRGNDQSGAVIFFNGTLNVVNTIFDQNSSGSISGALTLVNIPSANVINSTFYGNSANGNGGAINAFNTNLVVQNSLFNNNVGGQAPDIFFFSENEQQIISANNVLLGSVNGSGLSLGVNNVVELDPLFANPNSFDFSLQPFSPAHGNSDPNFLPIDIYDADNDGDTTDPIDFDLFGNPRGSTDGCNFDIGAVETAQGSLTVLNNNDSGVGSLRSHMECANANPNINQISFAIPGVGPQTINLASDLPPITGNDLVIDGTSQPGSSFEAPNLIIDGGGITNSIFSIFSNNVSILGMGLRNVINFRVIEISGAEFVTVSGNTISTNSGQDQIAFFNANNCNIFSNRIGIDVDGTPSALDRPFLWLDNSNNNRISLNTIAGVGGSISLGLVNGSSENEVFDNLIGTTESGLVVGGGTGILIADNANNNQITNNVIANHNNGITVSENSTQNLLSPNEFSCNRIFGIQIETGSQSDITPPEIRTISPSVIAGIAIAGATVDLYIQDNSQCPDAACQGNFFSSLSTNDNGVWSFQVPTDINLNGAIITAIQTDGNNNSSAFATCSLVACDLTAEVVTPLQINCNTPQVSLTASSNSPDALFTWTGPNGFSSTQQNPTVDEAGIYNLTVTDLSGCTQTAAIAVNGDFQQPDISLIGAQLDCNNPTTLLSGNSTTPNASFSWTGPNGFTADIRNPEISEPGEYIFTVTGPNGCTSSGPLTVIRDETVAPTAGFNLTINDDLSVTVEGTAGDEVSYFYDFGNGQTSTDQNSGTNYQTPGFITITQIVSNQCGADTLENLIELPSPPGALSFCFPEKTEGANGEILDIPIKVTNFNNVASIQMSIKVGDPAVAQILSVGDFALPDLDDSDFNVINDTTVTMAWFFGNGTSLPDSSTIFTVQVLLTATDALCTPIFIDDTPVFVEVGVLNQSANSIVSAPYQVVAGEVCIQPIANIRGQVFRETGDGLKEVEVACTDQTPVTTGPDGLYEFLELQTGLDYLISPSRNTNPVEGVTAIDLALIQRHILTLQFLDSPYKIIAADVDSSNSVGAIDLANIQRLILGRTNVFPNNMPSWRFVDADFQFTNPNNPFADAIPKDRLVADLRADVTDVDFIGMKLGDVNGSTMGRQLPDPLEVLIVENVEGNERTVEFRVKEAQALAAYQFDINFDPGQMQILEIIPGELPGINDNNFGFDQIAEGIIPTLWYDPSGNTAGYSLEAGQVLFSLKFRTGQELPSLENRVWTNDKTMPALAYTGAGGEMQIQPIYLQNTESGTELEVLSDQVQLEDLRPNPFSEQTQMHFYLPASARVNIQVRDALGRTVKRIEQQFEAGEHQIILKSTDLGPAGWYVVQLRTGDFSATKRIILQKR